MGWGLRMPCVLALSLTARRPSGVFGPRLVRLAPFLELISCPPLKPQALVSVLLKGPSTLQCTLAVPRFVHLIPPSIVSTSTYTLKRLFALALSSLSKGFSLVLVYLVRTAAVQNST